MSLSILPCLHEDHPTELDQTDDHEHSVRCVNCPTAQISYSTLDYCHATDERLYKLNFASLVTMQRYFLLGLQSSDSGSNEMTEIQGILDWTKEMMEIQEILDWTKEMVEIQEILDWFEGGDGHSRDYGSIRS